MSSMFSGCENLTSLDLSSFDTSQVTNMEEMFSSCTSLTTICASASFTTVSVTNDKNMFSDCTVLEGGKGTKYEEERVTGSKYAWIDGKVDPKTGSERKGYFTSMLNTVLFNDGTFIINEKFSDHAGNVIAHGAVNEMYEPLDADNPYVFDESEEASPEK